MITRVEINLDDDMPEYMSGVIRCGSVLSYDGNDDETNHQELIDNSEYRNETELISDVAKRLGITTDIIEIME